MFGFSKKNKKGKTTSRQINDDYYAVLSLKTLSEEDGELIEQQFAKKTGKNYRYIDTVVKRDGTRLHRLVAPYCSIKEASIMYDDGRTISYADFEKLNGE